MLSNPGIIKDTTLSIWLQVNSLILFETLLSGLSLFLCPLHWVRKFCSLQILCPFATDLLLHYSFHTFYLPPNCPLYFLCVSRLSLNLHSFRNKYFVYQVHTAEGSYIYFLRRDLDTLLLKNRVKQCDMVRLLIIRL